MSILGITITLDAQTVIDGGLALIIVGIVAGIYAQQHMRRGRR